MPAVARFVRRQLWANPNPSSYIPKECRPVRLRSGGLLNIGNDTLVTLAQDALFQPECDDYQNLSINASGFNISVLDDQEPFYASTSPQIYAIAAATVVSYMLLIILFITPRTFFVGGTGGGNGFLGRRGMISGASGSMSVIGVGSRPWLQKVAALTVAVSLTIASVDTFRIAEQQYDSGYQDASALTDAVADGMEIRVVRVISDTCLWLAQAQTLIRLFPRHKEKVMIKWAAFALILLDLIFSILNSFVYGNPKTRPRTFVDVVPALNYLFTIALSILYMAWVLYYSLSKRRFAFFHPKMRNIGLMAVLSLTAILIPVLFFVLDIAKPNVSGWGNYVRWVGAAAASVVVWEWVERIEALERDENKDGILGREIFDGDEMLDDIRSPAAPRDPGRGSGGGPLAGPWAARKDRSRSGTTSGWGGMNSFTTRLRKARLQHRSQMPGRNRQKRPVGETTLDTGTESPESRPYTRTTTPPPTTVSPVSRADTTSAASTVYRVHYHPTSEATPPIREEAESLTSHLHDTVQSRMERRPLSQGNQDQGSLMTMTTQQNPSGSVRPWQRLAYPFKRQSSSPPAEVSQALSSRDQMASSESALSAQRNSRYSGILGRLRNRDSRAVEEVDLPVTIIPWQPRGAAYLRSVENQAHQPQLAVEWFSSSRPSGGKVAVAGQPSDATGNANDKTEQSTEADHSQKPGVYDSNAISTPENGTRDRPRDLSPLSPISKANPLVDDPEHSRDAFPEHADVPGHVEFAPSAGDSSSV